MMIRFNSYLPSQLLERMRAHHKAVGVSVAEIIRRAIDEYLKRNKA